MTRQSTVGAPPDSSVLAGLRNTLTFIVNKPQRGLELARKIGARCKGKPDPAADFSWLRKNQESFESWAKSINAVAWDESLRFSEEMHRSAKNKLASVPFALGGGGIYPVLYFLTITKKPQTVVETGVAAGYSSQTFLKALRRNGSGKLYSSDFPYFRLPDPERYVGILVDDELRTDWSLFLEGDRTNLPMIMRQVTQIDLFHHDSDKSYAGRQLALDVIREKLSPSSYVLFDDIHANNFFHDLVTGADVDFKVFEFEGKFVGLVQNLSK